MDVEVVFSHTHSFHSPFRLGQTSTFLAGVPYCGEVTESGWYAGRYRVIRFDEPRAEVMVYECDLQSWRPVIRIALPAAIPSRQEEPPAQDDGEHGA